MRSEDWDMQHPSDQVKNEDAQPPSPDTARDKNAAAKALMDLGWTFEEVAIVLGYKVVDKESDRDD